MNRPQKLTQITAAIGNGAYQAPNKVMVSAWFREWLDTFCKNKVKPLTFQSCESVIKNHITPGIEAMEVQAVRGVHIQRIYNGMTAAGLSGKTVKNV